MTPTTTAVAATLALLLAAGAAHAHDTTAPVLISRGVPPLPSSSNLNSMSIAYQPVLPAAGP